MGYILLLLMTFCMYGGLLGKDAPVFTKEDQLSQAVQKGDLSTTKQLIDQGVSVNAYNTAGFTPLLISVDVPSLDMTQFLLDKGANVNLSISNSKIPWDGATPLYGAIVTNKDHAQDTLKRITMLLDKGADPNIKNGSNGTTLQAAVENDMPDVVALLIAHGANVRDDTRALNSAINMGSTNLVRLLVSKGANTQSIVETYVPDYSGPQVKMTKQQVPIKQLPDLYIMTLQNSIKSMQQDINNYREFDKVMIASAKKK
jgi:uncharacterized protein